MDLTLTVEFSDDGVQEGILRSHMAPADRHLCWTCGDLTRLLFVTRATQRFTTTTPRSSSEPHPKVPPTTTSFVQERQMMVPDLSGEKINKYFFLKK